MYDARSVRFVDLIQGLRGDPPVPNSEEDVDLEETLGGGIRKRKRSADGDESEK